MNYRAEDMAPFGGTEGWAALNKRLDDLVGLGGHEKIANMLHRFAEQLEAILDRPHNEWSEAALHRMIGVAGILGFSHLEQSWRPIEQGCPTSAQLETARAAATAAITFART